MTFSDLETLRSEIRQNEKSIRVLLVVAEAAAELILQPQEGVERVIQEAKLKAAIQAWLGLA